MRRTLFVYLSMALGLGFGLLASLPASGADDSKSEDFKPIKEADMPKGFPDYTPVGKVEVKKYPAYRKATTAGFGEFWTLFGHIKKNHVEMTAPVEMNYGDPKAAEPKRKAMAFLYERPDQGATGKDGNVDVVDVPAMTVLSLGCTGEQTGKAVDAARDKLVAWLDDHKSEYQADGPMRVMGYNSPFVPRDKNFFEVQIPIKAAPAGSTDK